MVKGYQDAKGAPLPNAHLMGLFQRLCKLLYFRIKPVFVFDGAFPELKKETIVSFVYVYLHFQNKNNLNLIYGHMTHLFHNNFRLRGKTVKQSTIQNLKE